MSEMQKLFEKVSKDAVLFAKFNQIMEMAEKDGKEATEGKLISFAQDAGFDLSISEMNEYFRILAETGTGELSDAELDLVAGGKSIVGSLGIVASVLTLGLGCLLISTDNEKSGRRCSEAFE